MRTRLRSNRQCCFRRGLTAAAPLVCLAMCGCHIVQVVDQAAPPQLVDVGGLVAALARSPFPRRD
ncbi:MAG: hypothetical protein R3C19_14145 [Planctomycetaceae bacterium]